MDDLLLDGSLAAIHQAVLNRKISVSEIAAWFIKRIEAIGMKGGFALDVQAVCSGFVYALAVADNFIKAGQVKRALVIGAETFSRILDWKDRNTCVLFGDGAGAAVLQRREGSSRGILATDTGSDGRYAHILHQVGGGTRVPITTAIKSRACCCVPVVLVAVNTGTKACENAPSANMRRPKLGIISATRNASMPAPAPNVVASMISRTKPRTRETSVMDPTTPVLRKMARLIYMT